MERAFDQLRRFSRQSRRDRTPCRLERFAARRGNAKRGEKRGRGVAYYFEASGGPPGPGPGQIRFTDNGAVEVYLATQSNGQGHETTFAQLVLRAPRRAVRTVIIKQGDTDFGLAGGGTVGSRSLQTSGNAIGVWRRASSTRAKSRPGKCSRQAVPRSNSKPVKAPAASCFRHQRTIGVTELALTLKRERLPGFESGLDEQATFKFAADISQWLPYLRGRGRSRNRDTWRSSRYVIVDDVGRVINPMIVDGQIHGGVAQGIGQALIENCVYDPEAGQLINGDLRRLRDAACGQYARPRYLYNEVPCKTNPLGRQRRGRGRYDRSAAGDHRRDFGRAWVCRISICRRRRKNLAGRAARRSVSYNIL